MTKKEFAIAQMEKWPMTRDGEAFDATIRVNRYDAAIAAWDKCIDVEVIPILEHFIFLLNAAENLYRPDKPVLEGLDPTFYHTLTQAGDQELINKTIAAKEALYTLKEKLK